jgi:SAM-dependent methyltransferase
VIDGHDDTAQLDDGFDAARYGASGIADEYDEIYATEWDTANAVACIAELADGGPLLEFGIGTGRLALPLVAAGSDVTGIDGSPEMVQVLRGKPGGDRIPVVIGDFASAEAGSDFGVVVLAVNTIFALPDQEAQVACFANAARHLRPGGLFVIEAWVPDLAAFHRNRLVRQRILDDGIVSIESARLEPAEQRMRTTQVVLRNGSVRLYPANHRYAWPAELDLMARLAGMQRVARWSDWTRAEFGDESRSHVTVYQRHDVTA